MTSLAGKVALITGASSGLGQAAALRLADQGVRVSLAARTMDKLEETARAIRGRVGEALVLPTDVTDAEACRHAVAATVERFGRLDILLCSAGLSMRSYFEGSDLAAMERVMRVNFFGTLYATHFALPHVKKQRGSLVAISSLTGKRGIPSYALYGASKFAIQGLYEALQVSCAATGSTSASSRPPSSIRRCGPTYWGPTANPGPSRRRLRSASGPSTSAWIASCV